MKNGIQLLPRIPVATYRLQFNGQFRFADAKKIVAYLHDLGMSDIYASPYFKAVPGSIHGYDIVDHNMLNPEIGTEQEYDELIDELHKYEMGQILDIVPNHMCVDNKDNKWWMDVLENGPSSAYSKFFDIDWDPVKKELQNKVLLPVLGEQYGKVLENQELVLSFDDGAFFIEYYEHRFPVRPQTFVIILEHRLEELRKLLLDEDPNFMELMSILTAIGHLPDYIETDEEKVTERQREKEIIKRRLFNLCNESAEVKAFIDENVRIFNGEKGNPQSFDLLDSLISKQIYRLSFWRVATEEINYRRFFDINSLGAIRVENPEVFRETHKLVMRLITEGKVTGLRVDHPDGLYNPSEYFRTLQQECFLHLRLGHAKKLGEETSSHASAGQESKILEQYDRITSSDPQFKPFYIVGEKILIKSEIMPEEWPIFSTTGYVFLNSVSGIFIDSKNAKAFDEIYARVLREKINCQDIIYEKKKLIMQVAMSSEIYTLAHYLNRISEKDRHTRDFTLNSLVDAIVEVAAIFPVYRTYINSYTVADRDRQYIEMAISKAKRRNPAISESIFDFLKDVFLLHFPDNFHEDDKMEWLDFVMRFQQITGPVMAKGVEDTSCYIYNRFVSLNEVGGMPERFGTPLETFHGQNIERMKNWPHALIATSTHDTKRSEDVRARMNVISEFPEEWKRRFLYWFKLNNKKKVVLDGNKVPDRNEEYLLYQTLIGVFPANIKDKAEHSSFTERIKNYMVKAIREAKVNTSWISPNVTYEDAMIIFIDSILNPLPGNQFLEDFIPFQNMISHFGMFNALSQALLKITSPGVPDFYQGTELWNFCLVDPDNRGPVDYSLRAVMFNDMKQKETEIGALRLSRELTENKNDGRIKLFTIYKSLNFRRANKDLFEMGEYLSLETGGERAFNICAFSRRLMNKMAIIAVPRLMTGLVAGPESFPFGNDVWKDSFIIVPHSEEGVQYRNIFTEELLTVRKHNNANMLYMSEIFANSAVALLERVNK